ncbi:MAG: hypothetical protein FJ390_03660 [Verrucomicrobia bacterium]|nr:hypothetical protein [Verrucomicrobiota bacterium]
MDTFALRSIKRQYGTSDISSPGEKVKLSSAIQTSQESTSHAGHFDAHQIQSVEEGHVKKDSSSLVLASPVSGREFLLEEHRIADLTPQKEQEASRLAASESRAIFPAISSLTDLDQLRRGSYEDSIITALARIDLAISKIYDYCDFYFNAPLDIPKEERAARLNQEFGFTGLSNNHGTCYLNAALQFAAEVIRTVEREGSPAEKQILHQNLERVPYFINFFHGSLETKDEQRALYREVSCEVSKSFWFGDGGPSLNQLESGFKKRGQSTPYIEHFLTQLQAPRVSFYSRSQGAERCYQVRTLLDGPLDEFTQLQDPGSSAKLVGELPSHFIRKCTFERSEEKSIGAIQFFHQDSHGDTTAITFFPQAVSISTRVPNHGFCLIHKNGAWYEINDNLIKKIPKKWEDDLFQFMAKNGTMVLYERQVNSTPREEWNTHQRSPEEVTEKEAIEPEEEIEPAIDPISISQEWKNFAQAMSKQSFYYHQRYQQFLKLEKKEPASSLVTLKEKADADQREQKDLKKINKIMKKSW